MSELSLELTEILSLMRAGKEDFRVLNTKEGSFFGHRITEIAHRL
jgi:hypothetical protein